MALINIQNIINKLGKRKIILLATLIVVILLSFNLIEYFKLGLYLDDWEFNAQAVYFFKQHGLVEYFKEYLFNKGYVSQRPVGYFLLSLIPVLFGQYLWAQRILLILLILASGYFYYRFLYLLCKNRLFSVLTAILISILPIKNSTMFWLCFGFVLALLGVSNNYFLQLHYI